VAKEEDKHQPPNSPLSEAGRAQAKLVAERLVGEGVEVLLSSHWARARQTAEAIGEQLGLEIQIYEEIYEHEHMPEMYGVSRGSPLDLQYRQELAVNMHNLDWKFGPGAESMREIVARAKEFRAFLRNNFLGKKVAAVSHGTFMKAFVVYCLLGDGYDDGGFHLVLRGLSFNNTSVSLLEYQENKEWWKIRYLNDFGHVRKLLDL
jgi:probable phosphoglycerate mutase